MEHSRLDREGDGDAGSTDMFAQVAGRELAIVADFDWRDIGADRADIVGDGFGEQGASVGYMTGKVTIKRLDFGVGQGEWKATDQVGNDVVVSFALRLTSAAH